MIITQNPTIYIINDEGLELVLEVTDHDYTPARAGKTYGPPENCYPAEPEEIEINDICIWLDGVIITPESKEAIDKIIDANRGALEEAIRKHEADDEEYRHLRRAEDARDAKLYG